ncbi:MAG: ribose-5-phosphate isomerase RpiA [Methanoregula sp.]|jgi:ribose 5-phosphate isomerase A|nr:ribose-5-phosphate isomerase RpiA [Methanoregula sp.]
MDDSAEALIAAKRAAGYKAADMIEEGMIIGLGTGSTVFYALERLSCRVREGLRVSGVPTSYQTARRAHEYGIPLTTLDEQPVLDLAVDGADQVDMHLRLIKGRGAALTKEKCVAAAADRFIVIIDEQKLANRLSAPVPVEVIPFAIRPVMTHLEDLGCRPVLREGIKKDGPVITDNGNFVVDCGFTILDRPEELENSIKMIPGVVDSGLFCGFARKTTVIVGNRKKCRVLTSADIVP